jgi:hypothetical protein
MLVLAAVVAVLGYLERHTIYRQVMLAVVADAASDTSDPEHQALEVLGEVRQIAPLAPSVVIDDDPAATLVRGWGWCDAMSMSYVQILERLGLRGRLLFLWNESGQSPHTVASVYLNGDWRLIDPQTGVVPRTAVGEIATVDDIASGAAPITGDWLVPADYGRASVFYESPESRIDPRGLLRVVAGWTASIAPHLVQDLYLLTPPPTFVDTSDQVWEDWSDPADRAYWRARNYDVFGRDQKAAEAYQLAIRQGSTHAAAAQLFLQR